jgi:ABC-2 type transport system permease protein
MKPSFLRAVAAVLRKELRVLFLSPLAWVFLSGFLFLGGLFFVVSVLTQGEASLRGAMANLGIALLFLLPLVTMRQIADEDRGGTLELVLTAPVPLGALIVGKWLSTVVLSCVLLLLTAPWPIVLFLYGDPDPGVLATSYLGLLACCCAFGAAGLFASSLTRDQMVAGVAAVLILVPFWLASATRDFAPVALQPWLDRWSLIEHLRSFAQGVLDTGDLAWFVGFTAVFLFLTWRSIESRRWA